MAHPHSNTRTLSPSPHRMWVKARPRSLGDQTQQPSFFSLLGAPPGATERRSIAPPGLRKRGIDGCRAFPGLAAGASISSNLNPRVPRLRRSATVSPFDAEHGCKQRSRGTRIIKVDGILERSPPLAGLTRIRRPPRPPDGLASAKAAPAQRERGREARHQDGQEPTQASCHGVLPAPLVLFILRVRRAQGMSKNPLPVPVLDCGQVRIDKEYC